MQPSRKRIALVVPSFHMGGGVPTVALFLYNTILDSGHYEVDVFSPTMSARDPYSIRVSVPSSWLAGIRIETACWQNTPFSHVGAFCAEFEFQRYQPRHILTERLNSYDLVQIVAGTPAWGLLAKNVTAPVALQVATLATIERTSILNQDAGYITIWRKLMTKLTGYLDYRALRFIDVAFVENQWMNQRLQEQMLPSCVVFAPPGIDMTQFHPQANVSGDYILSVGRFADPRKNVSLLFRAYRHLLNQVPSAPRLILAGFERPTTKDWQLAGELDITHKIQCLQNLTREALANLYRNATFFVLSSDEEGLGMVILEAMASGLPVLSTRCGGPETSVIDGETGFLTPVGNVEALANRMQQLVENPSLCKQMGNCAHKVAVEHFSLEAAGQVFLNKYEELLGVKN